MRYLTRTAGTARNAARFAAAIGLVAGGVALTAAPAQATTVCNLEVVSLKSWDLNDNDGQDEIKIELGNDLYGPWDMPDDWTRSASLGQLDEDFLGSVDVTLFVQDVTRQTIDSDPVSCSILGNRTLSLDGNGAIYRMVVNITER
jgi:hypothetical protein